MDLESKSSVLESVEDNEGISSIGHDASYEIHDSGSRMVENNNNDDLFSETREKTRAEVLGSMSSPLPKLDIKPIVSPCSTPKKGYGLKKWKRIKRDVNKIGGSNIDTGTEIRKLDGNMSKRMHIYDDREKTSKGSFSSTNTVISSVDGFVPLHDLGFESGVSFAPGAYSEHSESRSSKSSTAASGSGLPLDKTMMRGLKGIAESAKKARGECVKIEKENSHSSLESDSRSSNFVFVQGNYNSTNKGVQSQGREDYHGENGREDHDDEGEASDGHNEIDGKGRDEDFLHVDEVAESSSEVKEGTSENRGFSSNQDPIAQSLFTLQSAQAALEQELLKFKDIGKDIPNEESVSELDTGSLLNRELETEVEELFKQKLEAEVEYLAISSTAQKLRVAALDQTTFYEEQKALASEQIHVLDDLLDAKNKAAMLKKKAEKLENICEDISNTDEALKKINKYCTYFFFQVLLLVVILVVFMPQLSPNKEKVVPT